MRGKDVAVIAEGDPFFYGSFMYIHDRLAEDYETEVVPGVCSILGGAAVLGAPLVYRNQTLTVLSGVLPAEDLKTRLAATEAAAIMKLGKNLAKVRSVIDELGLIDRALYVERATMDAQRIFHWPKSIRTSSPYFSLILVPGEKWQVAPNDISVPYLVLSALGMETALRIKAGMPGVTIYGFEGRVDGRRCLLRQFWRNDPPALSERAMQSSPLRRWHYHPLTGLSSWQQGQQNRPFWRSPMMAVPLFRYWVAQLA